MRKVIAALALIVLGVGLASAPAQAHPLRVGTAHWWRYVSDHDNYALGHWNHLVSTNGGSHAWRVWHRAINLIPAAQLDQLQGVAERAWPRRVQSQVSDWTGALANEFASWETALAATEEHRAIKFRRFAHSALQLNHRYVWRYEKRVDAFFHLTPHPAPGG